MVGAWKVRFYTSRFLHLELDFWVQAESFDFRAEVMCECRLCADGWTVRNCILIRGMVQCNLKTTSIQSVQSDSSSRSSWADRLVSPIRAIVIKSWVQYYLTVLRGKSTQKTLEWLYPCACRGALSHHTGSCMLWLLTAALLLSSGPAGAQEDKTQQLAKPDYHIYHRKWANLYDFCWKCTVHLVDRHVKRSLLFDHVNHIPFEWLGTGDRTDCASARAQYPL